MAKTYSYAEVVCAMEWGFKACERGLNIQMAHREFLAVLNPPLVGGKPVPNSLPKISRNKGD